MPLTSRVGRVARRSSVVNPASPTSAGTPSGLVRLLVERERRDRRRSASDNGTTSS
jgi:hypothetical protein